MTSTLKDMHLRRSVWRKLTMISETEQVDYLSSVSFTDIITDIQHDLTTLLNHRQTPMAIPTCYTEISSSISQYGLPDFSHLNPHSGKDCEEMRQQLLTSINNFEPRLKQVHITIIKPEQEDISFLMYFRIHAVLALTPELLPISFNSIVDMELGKVTMESNYEP